MDVIEITRHLNIFFLSLCSRLELSNVIKMYIIVSYSWLWI